MLSYVLALASSDIFMLYHLLLKKAPLIMSVPSLVLIVV